MIETTCDNCKELFLKNTRDCNRNKKYNYNTYCSIECKNEGMKKLPVKCLNCNNYFRKKDVKQKFCSQSCAATYNNTHKTKGTRVSKLEIWLSEELPKLYPSLEFHFNRKDAINSELDIYIPSLKLAFELNGIFHYEPIFGKEKLAQIENNDQRKFQACLENSIELCTIDVSTFIHFKLNKAQKYLKIVCNLINLGLRTTGEI